MSTVQKQILDAFYSKLSKLGTVDESTIDELRKVLQSDNKLKAEDFVSILDKTPKDDKT